MPSPEAVAAAVRRLATRVEGRELTDVVEDVRQVVGEALGAGLVGPGGGAGGTTAALMERSALLEVAGGSALIVVVLDIEPAHLRQEATAVLSEAVGTSVRSGGAGVGIVTDGANWELHHLVGGHLRRAGQVELSAGLVSTRKLFAWLEAICATERGVRPVAEELRRRLGAESPSHAMDRAVLRSLYESVAEVPEVQLKRELWARLLRTALGNAFTDDLDLFVDHTLLVLWSEVIAHAVVGFDVGDGGEIAPTALVRGTAFEGAQIHGVIEADVFDWVLNAPGGAAFVQRFATRASRFGWASVEHDVLKVLYESIISAASRASLGEYYTPDWLAERMVEEVIDRPLEQSVLDPACGSGTFLFHAVRRYLDAAASDGVAPGSAVAGVVEHVRGIDIHPVAVTFARVTYLLAIGPDLLAHPDRGQLSIPVYLGDAMQWEQRADFLTDVDAVTISVRGDDLADAGTLFDDDLVFPRSVLREVSDFDWLVEVMAEKARTGTGRSADLIGPALRQLGLGAKDEEVLVATFESVRRLHATGSDQLWDSYARNLVRPVWLSDSDRHVDVLIGNPPWLRYSKMSPAMQERYKVLGRERGLLAGHLGASARDLSTLFAARCVELYLRKPGGRFRFVMPHGTLTRKPHEAFRSARWNTSVMEHASVAFDRPWDLAAVTTGFPMVACVVRGELETGVPAAMPNEVEIWKGRLPSPDLTWAEASERITISTGEVAALSSAAAVVSPYKRSFRQGAVLAPRALLFVERMVEEAGGLPIGRVAVRSRRTAVEKAPWKHVESLRGVVEQAFLRQVHLGETLLPYRLLPPLEAVLPVSDAALLDPAMLADHPAMSTWWGEAEAMWQAHKSAADRSSLADRVDFHGQLAAQLPVARYRVAYTKAGNAIAAALIEDRAPLIDHKLYWAPVTSREEGLFLVAILNSGYLLQRVQPLQAVGLFGARDFDKSIFSVPIPSFDVNDDAHRLLAEVAAEAQSAAESIDVSGVADFKRARAIVRRALEDAGIVKLIDDLVAKVVPDEAPAG